MSGARKTEKPVRMGCAYHQIMVVPCSVKIWS
jgi:hypothetical protein